jgi:hypothetical protein
MSDNNGGSSMEMALPAGAAQITAKEEHSG